VTTSASCSRLRQHGRPVDCPGTTDPVAACWARQRYSDARLTPKSWATSVTDRPDVTASSDRSWSYGSGTRSSPILEKLDGGSTVRPTTGNDVERQPFFDLKRQHAIDEAIDNLIRIVDIDNDCYLDLRDEVSSVIRGPAEFPGSSNVSSKSPSNLLDIFS
jgi:hypothetical protein